MRTTRALILLLIVLAPSAVRSEMLAIVGGTVHPVSGDAFVGTVVVDAGRITEVGPEVSVPAGARSIDAAGMHVYPGLMDAASQVGMVEVGAVAATDDRQEMGSYNTHLEATTAIHPSSELIPVARANGITHVLAVPQPSRDGVIGGRGALLNLDGWTVEEMTVRNSVVMAMSWPEIQTRQFDFSTFSWKESAFEDAKEEATEKQNELRDWFEAARHYKQAMGTKVVRAQSDLRLEYLARCIDGDMLAMVSANNKRDIEAVMDFAQEQNLKLVLVGGREAWKVAARLAEESVPVILGPTQTLPRDEDAPYFHPYALPSLLVEAGVKIAFGSGAQRSSPHSARLLPYEVATAVANGLSEEAAIKALTLWPAEILGVADEVGSIEPGKVANLLVTTGSPLVMVTEIRHLIIGGREVSTDNMHLSLYQKYRGRP